MSEINSIPLPPRVKDLTGRTFGRLTVVAYSGTNAHRQAVWRTACSCGTVKSVESKSLVTGDTNSCGCLRDEKVAAVRATHRLSSTAEYRAWADMWKRCTNDNDYYLRRYKTRTPPDEWKSFERFLADVGPNPGPGFTLDRIDNERPYGPGNCRWTTRHTQSRNMATNVWVTTPDGQRLCLTDACRVVGLVQSTYHWRRKQGQSIEEASNGLLKEAA